MFVAFKEALSLLCVFTIWSLISLDISPAIDGFSWLTHNDVHKKVYNPINCVKIKHCIKEQLSKSKWLLCYLTNSYNLPIELADEDLDKQAVWPGISEYFLFTQSADPQAT